MTVKVRVVQGQVPLSAKGAWGQLWRRLLGESSTPRMDKEAQLVQSQAAAVKAVPDGSRIKATTGSRSVVAKEDGDGSAESS